MKTQTNINSELKLEKAFLIEKYIQQVEKKVPSMAWLGRLRQTLS